MTRMTLPGLKQNENFDKEFVKTHVHTLAPYCYEDKQKKKMASRETVAKTRELASKFVSNVKNQK